MAWSWRWELSKIPTRMDFSKAEWRSGKRALPLAELSDDELTARCLATMFNHLDVWESLIYEPELIEVLERAQKNEAESHTAFSLSGLTARELALRANRALLNLRVLSGIERMLFSDVFEQLSIAAKFLSSLSDDEIAELLSVTEFAQVNGDWWANQVQAFGVPFHKEILMEAYHNRYEARKMPASNMSTPKNSKD